MAEERPVAIRIFRPFESEDEFLAREIESLTKTTVVLLGTQPRPVGVILRFELLLANGEPLLRGEGRVLGHKDDAYAGLPGLTLRFTRLDPRSKALVDKAALLRNPDGAPSLPPPPERPSHPPLEVTAVRPISAESLVPAAPEPLAPSFRPDVAGAANESTVAPATKNALLDRLRDRVKRMPAETLSELLQRKRTD